MIADGCLLKKCPFDRRVALIFFFFSVKRNRAVQLSWQNYTKAVRGLPIPSLCKLWALEDAVIFSLKLKQVRVLSVEQRVSSVDVESASKTSLVTIIWWLSLRSLS